MRGLSGAVLAVAFAVVVAASPAAAQRSARPNPSPSRSPAPAKVAPTTEPADVTCPEELGVGLRTKASFCFVLAGRNPADGVLVKIPPNTAATLSFDIHNRHTYSEEEVRRPRLRPLHRGDWRPDDDRDAAGARRSPGGVPHRQGPLRSHRRRGRARRHQGGRTARARAGVDPDSRRRRSGQLAGRGAGGDDVGREGSGDAGAAGRDHQQRPDR